MQQNPSVNKRVLFLDMLRGLAVLNMVLYHLLYDMVYIFGVSVSWFSISKCFVWEQWICFTFILIAGVSFRLSRKPWKNGLKLFGCGMILTIVTVLVIPEELILFGILHFLGCAILITWVLWPLLKKIPVVLGFIGSLLLFIFIRHITAGWIGIHGLWVYGMPAWPYERDYLFWAGFPSPAFMSSDYFPVLPWIFLFLTGCFGGVLWFRQSEKVNAVGENRIYKALDRSLGTVGRKSLWIYMLHQPVLYGTLLILQKMGLING